MSRIASPFTSTTWPQRFTRFGTAATTIPQRRFLIENNPQLSRSRLELARGIGQIIKNGLGLMGVEAAEEMR